MNRALLTGLDERIAAVSTRITVLQQQTAGAVARIRNDLLLKGHSWQCRPLEIPLDKRIPNSDGTPGRFSFTSYGYMGDQGPFSLLGTFRVRYVRVAQRDPQAAGVRRIRLRVPGPALSGPKRAAGDPARPLAGDVRGWPDYWVPLSPALEREAKTDPDILLVSQDGLTGRKMLRLGRYALNLHNAGNPNNPKLLAYTADYLRTSPCNTLRRPGRWTSSSPPGNRTTPSRQPRRLGRLFPGRWATTRRGSRHSEIT